MKTQTQTQTVQKFLLPLAVGILLAFCASSRAQYIFSETFDGYYNGNQNASQLDTGLPISYGGLLPGWNASGDGAIHAVNQDGVTNYAIMIFDGNPNPNIVTLASGIAANDSGKLYQVAFVAGPAAYAHTNEMTSTNQIFKISVLRGDNSVLYQWQQPLGAWPQALVLSPYSFNYVGDGSGPVRLQITTATPGDVHFSGAIDNLTVTNLGSATIPTITNQPTGGTVEQGSVFTFTVGANLATTYQWKKNGNTVAGATGSSYTILNASSNDIATYTVAVSNAAGGVLSSGAMLNVTNAPTYANYQSAVLANGPIHYYPLQETSGTAATDLGSQAANGAYTGGFTLGQSTGEPTLGFSHCVHFNGQPGTYVNLGNFSFTPGQSLTLEAWVNLDTTADPTAYYDILGNFPDYGIGFVPGDGVKMYTSSTGVTTPPASLGQWHYLVGVYDGTANTSTVWMDGVQGPAKSGGSGLTAFSSNPVLIAASRDGSNNSFNLKGYVAEVAIYTNALSAAQLRIHFRTAVPSIPPISIANAVIVSWPSLPPGYVLQTSPNVAGPYVNYSGSIYGNGNNFIAPVPTGSSNSFFRLSGQAP